MYRVPADERTVPVALVLWYRDYVYRSGKPSLPRATLRLPSSMAKLGGKALNCTYNTMLNCMGTWCSWTLGHACIASTVSCTPCQSEPRLCCALPVALELAPLSWRQCRRGGRIRYLLDPAKVPVLVISKCCGQGGEAAGDGLAVLWSCT